MSEEYEVSTKGGDAQHIANLYKTKILDDALAWGVRYRRVVWFGVATPFFGILAVLIAPSFNHGLVLFAYLAVLVGLALHAVLKDEQAVCDLCGNKTSLSMGWHCGFCEALNNRNPSQRIAAFFTHAKALVTFVEPCEHCGKKSPAIACYDCGEHTVVDPLNYLDNINHVAWYQDGAKPVQKEVRKV